MSISTEDRDYLVAMIDLNTCLANNDVALAESVRDTLNALEQGELLTNTVGEAVRDGNLLNHPENADAYRIIIEGVACIEAKAYKLKVLAASVVLSGGDADSVAAWLEQNAVESLDLSHDENQLTYASFLIRMCVAAKRYDIMEGIRAKLKEVE